MARAASEGSFWDHLEELRKRILYMLGALTVCTVAAFAFSRHLMSAVLWACPTGLQTLSPYEALTANLRIALTAGLIASSPFISWHVWRFLSPGLHREERKALLLGTVAAFLLFCSGVAFSVLVLLEPTLTLFRSFEGGMITGNWTLSGYIAFLAQFVLVFGLSFELPILVVLLSYLGIVDPKTMGRYRRHVIVGLLVLGAILPPNDPLTQVLLAAPLYLLYGAGMILARLLTGRRTRPPREIRPGPS
jgi:sec-independent protein translocase protein TatC